MITLLTRPFNSLPNCGDQGAWWCGQRRLVFALADGLGHGVHAEQASLAVVEYLSNTLDPDAEVAFESWFDGCNQAARGTRGTALGIAVVELIDNRIDFCGIGNVMLIAKHANGQMHHLQSDPGIVGDSYRHLRRSSLDYVPGDLVLLHTDGISQHMDLERYDDVLWRDLTAFAETLMDDWGKPSDDAGLLLFCDPV